MRFVCVRAMGVGPYIWSLIGVGFWAGIWGIVCIKGSLWKILKYAVLDEGIMRISGIIGRDVL